MESATQGQQGIAMVKKHLLLYTSLTPIEVLKSAVLYYSK